MPCCWRPADHWRTRALAKAAIVSHGLSVAWRSGPELYGSFRDAIGQDEPESAVVARLIFPTILILSDPLPPKGVLTDYQAQTLYRVIDGRYRECRRSWVSLNMADGSEADDRLGAALVDRLREGAVIVHCNWPSYRRPQPT